VLVQIVGIVFAAVATGFWTFGSHAVYPPILMPAVTFVVLVGAILLALVAYLATLRQRAAHIYEVRFDSDGVHVLRDGTEANLVRWEQARLLEVWSGSAPGVTYYRGSQMIERSGY
jgi:hypothetical protein